MNYYGVTRSTNTLSHYGVKGMKWGVRKAILSGNARSLNRHYRKAAKKLAKLQDMGINHKKYAAKAAAYGAAAAGVGTLAIAPKKAIRAGLKVAHKIVGTETKAGFATTKAGYKLNNFLHGRTTIIKPTTRHLGSIVSTGSDGKVIRESISNKTKGLSISNRIYPGIVAAGLGAKAIQNAYRATHGKKYRKKAVEFKRQMDESFKGTPYEGHYTLPPKRRRRRRNYR